MLLHAITPPVAVILKTHSQNTNIIHPLKAFSQSCQERLHAILRLTFLVSSRLGDARSQL